VASRLSGFVCLWVYLLLHDRDVQYLDSVLVEKRRLESMHAGVSQNLHQPPFPQELRYNDGQKVAWRQLLPRIAQVILYAR
jgi:hypothetical protein